MSPKLSTKVLKNGGIERRGVWAGKNGRSFPHLPEIKQLEDAASDHAHYGWTSIYEYCSMNTVSKTWYCTHNTMMEFNDSKFFEIIGIDQEEKLTMKARCRCRHLTSFEYFLKEQTMLFTLSEVSTIFAIAIASRTSLCSHSY